MSFKGGHSQAPAWECLSLLIVYMRIIIDVCIPNEDKREI